MEFKDLSDWIVIDGNCATRIKKDGDVNIIKDRVAFIEKTPRVRVDKYKYSVECHDEYGGDMEDRDAWIFGYSDSDYGFSEDSRKWCDDMLKLLGYK